VDRGTSDKTAQNFRKQRGGVLARREFAIGEGSRAELLECAATHERQAGTGVLKLARGGQCGHLVGRRVDRWLGHVQFEKEGVVFARSWQQH
jgi:hypothetical protein